MIQFLLIVCGGTAGIVVLAILIARAMRKTKRRPVSLGSIGWVLLFFSSGRMPPPPPQSQIELETRSKKNRSIARNKEDEMPPPKK